MIFLQKWQCTRESSELLSFEVSEGTSLLVMNKISSWRRELSLSNTVTVGGAHVMVHLCVCFLIIICFEWVKCPIINNIKNKIAIFLIHCYRNMIFGKHKWGLELCGWAKETWGDWIGFGVSLSLYLHNRTIGQIVTKQKQRISYDWICMWYLPFW